jgi:hypothetical protein
MDKINSSVDDVLKPVVKDLYAKVYPDLNQQTTLPEDHNTVTGMIKSAINKSADPSSVTSTSDSVNRNPGDSVGLAIGSQSTADLVAGVANTAGTPTSSGLATVPQGGFSTSSETSSGVFDSGKKMQQKVLNSIAACITGKPDVVPELAQSSANRFINSGGELGVTFSRHSQLIDKIRVDTNSIDINYYKGTGIFRRTENSVAILRSADTDLLSIRQELVTTSDFNEGHYQYVRDYEILAAAQALVDYGGPNNKIVQIRGALTALDYLMSLIERLYNDFFSFLQGMIDYFDKFITRMLFKGPMLAMLNQIQAEVRSIIRSMDATLARRQAYTMPLMERLWYMQLLITYHKMFLTPQNVVNYFNTDPHGYINAYAPISSALSAIALPSDVSLLRAQTDQYKYWVQRRLDDSWPNNPNIMININNLSSQIQNDNTTTTNKINTATTAASGYSVPLSDLPKKIFNLLSIAGMDRGYELMERANWPEFFSLTPDNASYKGNLAISLGAAMAAAVANPETSFNTLESISNAQRAILNQKRSTDLLSSTQERFKADGQQAILEDMQDTQTTVAAVEKLQTTQGPEF